MIRRRNALLVLVVLLLCAFTFAAPSHAQQGDSQTVSGEWAPHNTVVLANRVDARFGRDFSSLLKHLRLQWVILESATVPDEVRNRNVILVGRLDATHTGEIVRGLLGEQELTDFRAAGEPVVRETESPWSKDRRVLLALGTDPISTRDAAERAIRSLIAAAPPAEAWIRPAYAAPSDAEPGETLRKAVERLTYTWDDEELPLSDLTIDVDAKPARRVSAAQAAEDVERLFYLFSHAYSGYAFFNQEGAFERAQVRILDELSARSHWSGKDLARLFHEQLGFILDCHLKIGGLQYAAHADFWYDTRRELALAEEGVQFVDDGALYIVSSINDQDPAPYLFPSLNARGDPIYRLGTLSKVKPGPLRVVAVRDGEERHFEVALRRSDFFSYSDDLFREDSLGGIPVIRVQSFSDHHADALESFVDTAAAHKGAPALIVDVRGNGGGNEAWPIRWIQGLTGQRAEAIFAFSELHSQTTLIGRANVFAYMYDRYPRTENYGQEAEQHTHLAQAYEDGTHAPNWVGPYTPQMPLIANDTTLVLVTNEYVASAGEGLIMRASQLENVVVVGENSMGCVHFGNAGLYQLPHSRMRVHMPINFGVYPDLTFREERGLTPDLWVPAADAVDYAVAALRSGTLTTYQPLSSEQMQQPFVPESTWSRVLWQQIRRFWPIAIVVVAGSVWAYFMRKKPRVVALVGVLWVVVGTVLASRGKPTSKGLLGLGAICLIWAGINVWRARQASTDEDILSPCP